MKQLKSYKNTLHTHAHTYTQSKYILKLLILLFKSWFLGQDFTIQLCGTMAAGKSQLFIFDKDQDYLDKNQKGIG